MTHLLLLIIYLSFISLGLPDSLLGSAWPSMYGTFGVPVAWAGAVSMIISLGTMTSSLPMSSLWPGRPPTARILGTRAP